MGWKAKYLGHNGSSARFSTRNRGEFSVPIAGIAWSQLEQLEGGCMVEVDTRDNAVHAIRRLEDRPQGQGGGPPRSGGGRYQRSPETERAIMFQSVFSSLCTLHAGQARDGSELAREALRTVEWYLASQGASTEQHKHPAAASPPASAYEEDAANADIPY